MKTTLTALALIVTLLLTTCTAATPTTQHWYDECPGAPNCATPEPTHTPYPEPTCYPTPTCPSLTPYPTYTPYPTQPPLTTPPPTATTHPLTPTPTTSPLPTPTKPASPTPTPTSVWHGIVRVSMQDMQTVAHNVGGTVLEVATSSSSTEEINTILDQAQASGYQIILNLYSRTTPTNRPWYLDGDEWVFPQSTVELLQEIAHHPAMFAIYALHEGFDAGVSWEKQLELYQLLKGYTDGLPVYSFVSNLWRKENADIPLQDGWCDLCGISDDCFRDDWTSARSLQHIADAIDTDLDIQQRLMPNSQVVFQIQTYSGAATASIPRRLPTPQELRTVRDYLCALNQPVMYYPWQHGSYAETLSDAPQLWPAIAEGCNGETQPTPTTAPSSTPTNTPMSTPTSTPASTNTPQPTSTPQPNGAVIIDHTMVDAGAIPQAWLDAARQLDTYFTVRSIGQEIIANGLVPLASSNPTRYALNIKYTKDPGWYDSNNGLAWNMEVGRGEPAVKVTNFARWVRNGFHPDSAMMKFCWSNVPPATVTTAEEAWQVYRETMEELEADYPDTTFVWWTMPLNSAGGHLSYNINHAIFNSLARAYCATNGCVLFDIADIESHDPNGNPISHSGHEAMWPGWSYDGKHLNENGTARAAHALWHLWARVAGWKP